jgi:CheY-like chemotaxis protein
MSESVTKPLTLLVLDSARAAIDHLPAQLGDQLSVQVATSITHALTLLRSSAVDLVALPPDELLAELNRIQLNETQGVLDDVVARGVCVCDAEGHFVWANPRLLEFDEPVRAEIKRLCIEAVAWAREGEFHCASHQRGRHTTILLDGATFEMHVTPVMDEAGSVTQVAAVVWDATRDRAVRAKIDAIERAAEELINFDADQIQRLDMQQRLDLLEQKVIRYTHDLMNFDNFTVHLLDKKTNKLELVLSTGMPSGVREIPIYAQPDGNGISGYVAAQGRSYVCPDVTRDERYIAGLEEAGSCLVVPLRRHGDVIGVFNIESRQLGAFDEDDRRFAEIFARHIATALHTLNLLVSERQRVVGEFANDVGGEITGSLNDILTEVHNLVDDYIGHDELRARLNQISDNAAKVRDALRRVTTPQRGLIGWRKSTNAGGGDPILRGRRILVVDDEDVIRETVGDVLRGCGCEIQEAADGPEGIACIGAQDFDLVLSDIKMPTQSGYEVFAAAKERNSECPVILMTGFGYDPNHAIVRARREGLAAVLFKPFKVEQLLGEIRTAIRATSKT